MLCKTRISITVNIFLVFLMGVVPALAAASTTIRNVPPTRHFAPIGTPLVRIAAAIKLAADEEGWHIGGEAPGVIQALLRVRTHRASVTIGFDELNFWIDYLDSSNLDYSPDGRKKTKTRNEVKGPRIHRNYNRWVDQLAKSISIHTRVPPESMSTDTVPARSPILIADELEKLDALRQRGVLSQEEFDQQKTKLLAQ